MNVPRRAQAGGFSEIPPRNARELAFVVLDAHAQTGAFVAQLLDDRAANPAVSSDDRRLASEIAYGVVRRQATLDALLEPQVTRPRQRVEDALWTLMRIGAYQLVFTAVPPHAAVHETVEVVRALSKPQWAGFLNGVLRSVGRLLDDSRPAANGPAADSIPLATGRYRHFSQNVFPDPAGDPAGYLATAFSFPRWILDRWSERHDFDALVKLGFWFDAPPPMWLRVNLLRVTRQDFLATLHAAEIQAEPGVLPESVRLDSPTRVESLPGYADGWFAVQDESAMQAGRLLAPAPGSTVLDLCAAPGTKTSHLAELMGNRGRILAADVDARRLALVKDNCRRLGIDIVETRLIAHDAAILPAGPFDFVLLDVPCSNTGVLGKRPEARWRLRPQDIEELSSIQKRLLSVALARLKPGGKLVYSTCSMEPEENEDVVGAGLRNRPALQLISAVHHRPGQPADGGYQALLARK